MTIRKALRTAQTYAPALVEAKTWSQRTLRRLRHAPSDASYRAFETLGLEPGRQFIDIGANRGQTIDSFRLYQRAAPVGAFEPNTSLASRLAKQYTQDHLISIHPFGLGRESGSFDLFVPYYRGFIFDGLASFDWQSAHDWLNEDRIYGFNARHLEIEKLRCEVRRWDDVETLPGLVKIDVQGHETSVLEGGINTIRKFRPIFLIENGNCQHEDLLFGERYRRAAYEHGALTLDKIGEKNTFYIPEEHSRRTYTRFPTT